MKLSDAITLVVADYWKDGTILLEDEVVEYVKETDNLTVDEVKSWQSDLISDDLRTAFITIIES